MESPNWLPLSNYASKYGISISTLRRRIKTEQIEYKRFEGKYFLLDLEPPAGLAAEAADSATRTEPEDSSEETVIVSAGKLLNELKKAYSSILQNKEEQIIQLKEEVTDLKTLVRVLEQDNERLKKLLFAEN